ncbi:type II toxin-antitoxin system RelE/ParE family toxin [Actomonas aquatica]|uniref:Type II toxin-antitoxin system RelE/ParE family toxin n=1 Tax=Actomonas aquatica TaxID=2866162 RepID=A0ABZ1C7U6_9BACT|nr:type II toxin-antitoxin system RelE/ParE family toxin [Opitutus sp. WL0086]WRQ87776.1 type II toxin-antitoxin system RelE/ParE family toxin [Opitutus sp. WL0086]
MDYKVVLSPRAIEDLRDIVLYISPDRPETARRLGLALVEKTKTLAQFPLSGRIVPEFGDSTIRELILRPYRIVYCVDARSAVVGVARFWHGAREEIGNEDMG